jgi:selenide,water dikinase
VISGLAAADDAAIYRLTENLCLVQTVDVFTPCVDDARLFGKICAANCLSDIYAMGGTPRTALSVLAFPSEKLPGEIVYQMLAGAMETFQEAGVALVGGHSVKDDEIKLGFAITGLIDPAVAAALEKPNTGDILVLTKPLGTGVLTFARQIGREFSEGLTVAEISMATLNRAAAEAMQETGASACTDITGFGFFAHLRRMLRQSKLGAEIYAESLPAFPGAADALRQGIIPGAIERNREYTGDAIQLAPGVDEAVVNLGFDAQTSGGLLIAVPVEKLEKLRESLARHDAGAFVVGKIVGEAAGQIFVKPSAETGSANSPLKPKDNHSMKNPETEVAPHGEGCCADIFKNEATQSSVAESQKAFGALMRSVQSPGALDEKTKELILFSQVVGSRCQPCFDAHFRKARDMGISQAELDEAAWCAIAMGGAPVKMFYQENLERLK